MFRLKRQKSDFWSKSTELRDIDLAVGATTEDIEPGSGTGWSKLWHQDVEPNDDERWASFVGGDLHPKREVAWLMG